jgi:hypothetical protein
MVILRKASGKRRKGLEWARGRQGMDAVFRYRRRLLIPRSCLVDVAILTGERSLSCLIFDKRNLKVRWGITLADEKKRKCINLLVYIILYY